MSLKSLFCTLLLAGVAMPAAANFDYSLRVECGRFAGVYEERAFIETVATIAGGRAGGESVHFKLLGNNPTGDYYYFQNNAYPLMGRLLLEARDQRRPINICYRRSDALVHGIEFPR